MIEAICRTSLDDYDCKDVKSFVALPRVGESVMVLNHGSKVKLKIVSITHDVRHAYQPNNNLHSDKVPYIIVELHK